MLKIYLLILSVIFSSFVFAQNDSLIINKEGGISKTVGVTTIQKEKKYNPAIAIRRSAFIPGWGQATNKKYWKIPVIYAGLGFTTYVFLTNLRQYKDSKEAYRLAIDDDPSNDYLIKEPYYTVKNQPDRIRVFRNQVRQSLDYSVLIFIGIWGLNVADAAVDANLKTFDVSDDLSFIIKGGYSPMAATNGISFILQIK